MEGLKRQFRRGRRFIVLADDGSGRKTVLFTSRDALLKRQQAGPATFAVCNLEAMFGFFEQHVGATRLELGTTEVAELCSWHYSVLDARLRDTTIVASACPARGHGYERRFTRLEAFAAAAVAALGRQGAGIATMRRVFEVIIAADAGHDLPTTAGAFAAV